MSPGYDSADQPEGNNGNEYIVQYSTVHAVQCSTVQYSTVQWAVQYSTVQYSTVQWAVQYSTVQYSTQYKVQCTQNLIITNKAATLFH